MSQITQPYRLLEKQHRPHGPTFVFLKWERHSKRTLIFAGKPVKYVMFFTYLFTYLNTVHRRVQHYGYAAADYALFSLFWH